MQFNSSITLVAIMMSCSTVAVAEDAAYEIQKKMLFQPGEHVIASEIENNRIYIYEGMKLVDVERAMDEQFDRVENMMFIRTRFPAGENDDSEHSTEQDGCDF